MRTLRELRSDSVIILDRSSSDATLLVVPLVAGCALLAATQSPGGMLGWGSAAILASVAGALVWAALPRSRSYELGPSSVLVLDPDDRSEDSFYRVDLIRDGERVRLLEHPDLDVVLADVRRLTDELGVRVIPAWGIPAQFFELPPSGGRATLRPGRVSGNTSPTQRAIARACFGAGTFVFVVFLWTVLHARAVSPLSIVLPLLSIAFVLFVGVWSASRRTEVVSTSDALHVTRVELGWRRDRLEISIDELVAAFAVGHEGREAQGVVFQTSGGQRAVPIAGDSAERAAELVQSSLPETLATDPDGAIASRGDTAARRAHSVRSIPVPRSRKYPC